MGPRAHIATAPPPGGGGPSRARRGRSPHVRPLVGRVAHGGRRRTAAAAARVGRPGGPHLGQCGCGPHPGRCGGRAPLGAVQGKEGEASWSPTPTPPPQPNWARGRLSPLPSRLGLGESFPLPQVPPPLGHLYKPPAPPIWRYTSLDLF